MLERVCIGEIIVIIFLWGSVRWTLELTGLGPLSVTYSSFQTVMEENHFMGWYVICNDNTRPLVCMHVFMCVSGQVHVCICECVYVCMCMWWKCVYLINPISTCILSPCITSTESLLPHPGYHSLTTQPKNTHTHTHTLLACYIGGP